MALTLISEHDITSSVSSLAISSGITDAYDVYELHLYNVHASAGDHPNYGYLSFICNQTSITSSAYGAQHSENDSAAYVFERFQNSQYSSENIQQLITMSSNAHNEEGVNGILTFYDPASSLPTHFDSRMTQTSTSTGGIYNYAQDFYVNGYVDSTTAVTSVTFRFNNHTGSVAGTLDDGEIKLFGVS
tara:strand:+ start:60 stop:623 length:564 start_codon:yes stop_codon:yes gene_type:complete